MTHHFISSAQKALPKSSPAALKKFLPLFYETVPEEDLEQLDPITMAHAAQTHHKLSSKRRNGDTHIEVRTPTLDQDGWSIGATIIDIVSDDMAFLIDSVVAEIVRQKQTVKMLVHPILYLDGPQKNPKISTRPEDEMRAQSHLHIHLQDALTGAQCEEMVMGLARILEDVDYATRDWIQMRKKLREAQKELSNAPRSYDDHLIEEYQAFLEYLHDNNFTLLGFRQYKFKKQKDKVVSETLEDSSMGLLHDDVKPVYINEARKALSQPLQKLRHSQSALTIAKVNKRSTVHRRVPLDAIAVKTFDKTGKVTGEMLFIGLFTSVTYSRSVGDIPYLRLKVHNVMQRSDFVAGGHDRKALRHILEKYPRDEVLQIDEKSLYNHAVSILRLQERPRIALYTRKDPFERYISCLVYVPRDRYETRLRLKIQQILEQEMGGHCSSYQVTQDDSPLARVIYWIDINHLESVPKYNVRKIEQKLEEAGRIWSERLRYALADALEDEEEVTSLTHKYGRSFPVSYHETYTPRQAVYDIRKIESIAQTEEIAVDVYRPSDCTEGRIRLKIFSGRVPITLSDVLPVLENMGLRVLSELPFEIQPADAQYKIWIHDFLMELKDNGSLKSLADVKEIFEEALLRIWGGEMENDGLNKLVLCAQMGWRDVSILRTYVRYMRQMRYPFSRPYIEGALTSNPAISGSLIRLFDSLHNPAHSGQNNIMAAGCNVEIDYQLEQVDSLDQDRILRSLLTLIDRTLRTNFYQADEDDNPKPYISLKLESPRIDDLPEPRPYREIFVYSPRVEGVHLRGDKIARGGLRWSDRHEDFRTEILGLMKAQQVKNAVIVPMGAKGGFVVKKPPREGGRDAFLAEGIECYKTFLRGLLDITDNRMGETILPPKYVVRRDGDDPYLVVAADKGTATFSDIANGLSEEYGFWMGDAFASGGSAGYDHKKMGITARGAWESVKRHFRELNHDTQTQPFDVVGVGDMGGDVFGNGMLLSEHIRLIGAFNHLHIFCDPDPDTAATYKERKRLFDAVKGWDAYNTKLLSKGGRIFSRSDKSLQLTPEIQKAFDIPRERVTPNELMRAMLTSRTDLLWFGGIGTYIKSTKETHAQAGDKANDAIRIDAPELRAKVVGEGANLGVTQLGRIEFAESGGRVNADYIDNSGGVDSSDHEVNIKILMGDVMRMAKYKMDIPKRDKLLASLTDEVAALVLRNNYQQAQGISMMELKAPEQIGAHRQLMVELERHASLNRQLEGLPDDELIDARQRAGKGLTRPELAVLQAYAKIHITGLLLESDIPDSKAMEGRLLKYFPKKLAKDYEKQALGHMLKREIICTTLANSMTNRMGMTFLMERVDKIGTTAEEVAKAYIIVREAFDLRSMWNAIEALDNKVPAQVQLRAFLDIARMTERAVTWFLTRLGRDLDINKDIAAYEGGIKDLKKKLSSVATPDLYETMEHATQRGMQDGLPEKLSRDLALMPMLASSCDIIRIAQQMKTDLDLPARVYFELGAHFHLDWLRQQARYLPVDNRYADEALDGVIDQLYGSQAGLTVRVLKDMKDTKTDAKNLFRNWLETHGTQAQAIEPLFNDMRAAASVDLPMLIIAEQRLRNLYGG